MITVSTPVQGTTLSRQEQKIKTRLPRCARNDKTKKAMGNAHFHAGSRLYLETAKTKKRDCRAALAMTSEVINQSFLKINRMPPNPKKGRGRIVRGRRTVIYETTIFNVAVQGTTLNRQEQRIKTRLPRCARNDKTKKAMSTDHTAKQYHSTEN